MNRSRITLFLCSILLLSCVTMKNSSGYIITNKSHNDYYKQAYCNDQEAVAWYEMDGFNYLGLVFFRLEYEYYVVAIKDEVHRISIDKIMPLDVAQIEAQKIAKDAGFNTYDEFQKFTEEQKQKQKEEQKKLAEEQRKQREQENRRLQIETDEKFGVQSIIGKEDIVNGNLETGKIYRIHDIVYVYNYDDNSFIITVTDKLNGTPTPELLVVGKDLLSADVKRVDWDGGGVGYIVRYIGAREVLTRASLIKVVHAFEFIGGNKYIEYEVVNAQEPLRLRAW